MKQFITIVLSLVFFSCQQDHVKYSETIIDDYKVNTEFLSKIDDAEKALVTGYLYAYGNECLDTSTNVKRQVLDMTDVIHECDSTHLNFLSQWFKNDVVMFYKLKKCPNLSYTSAIQNQIKKMELLRHNDTIQISVLVHGLNNSEEKNWHSNQTETFLIENNTFVKLENEITNCKKK